MRNDSERPILKEHVGEVVEVRGIANVTVPPQGKKEVEHNMQSIGGKGNGPVQIIQNDQVIGVVHHINISDISVSSEEQIEVIKSIVPGDIVRYVGVVCEYKGYRGVPKYDVKKISEIEII